MSDNIFGRASHVAGIKGSSRVQSQAGMSTDWRKRAAAKRAGAISSPGPAAQRSDPSYDENYQLCGRLDFDRSDTSFSAPQYRYPKEKKARWEAVLSAPGWQAPSSSSSMCGEAGSDVTRVQLRSVNPITTKVNGEDIPLTDRFCFEVVPVFGHQVIAGLKFAELTPLNGSTAYRVPSSGSNNDLLMELQTIARSTWGTPSSTTPTSSEDHGLPMEATGAQANQVGSGSGFPAAAPNSSDEAARFQAMLGRLQGNHQSPPLAHEASVPVLPSSPPDDPAIIAVKVGDVKARRTERSHHTGLYKAAANTFFAQRLNEMRTAKHQTSGDSGYVSNDKGKSPVRQSNVLRPATTSPSLDDGQTKVLNPAAAEFKSSATDDGAQWLSPKKLSRQPLTNIFPDAMASHLPLPATTARESSLAPNFQRAGVPTAAGSGKNPLAKPWIPTSQPVAVPVAAEPGKNPLAKPWIPTSQRALFPSELPLGNTLSQQMLPPLGMAATMPASALAGSPMLATLRGLPPAAANFAAPLNIGQMGFPAVNGYHTFPPTPGSLPMPVFSQTPAPPGLLPVPSPMFNTTGLQPPQQQQAQQQPLPVPGGDSNASTLNTGNKPARPYFPVTTKPRDRDPVKQQMYEAYLEWRKANEPGYHMKCKIRQAQRVVRQHQQQAQVQHQQQQKVQGQRQEDGNKSAGAGDSAA